jgi:molybdate transport system substrate-binding protein
MQGQRFLRSNTFRVSLTALVLVSGMVLEARAADSDTVTVFAAASTTNAITEIAEQFALHESGKAVTSFAASSALAKQIENGAPADLFISADEKWMDYLQARQLIDPGSRTALLGNRLVLIAPKGSGIGSVEIKAGLSLHALLGGARLAMGDPAHVPAGIYGRHALESLNMWDSIKDQLAPAKDVRAALTLVERGEVPLGLVYATDAAVSAKVQVVGTFPEQSHPAIVYPAALVAGGHRELAGQFLGFLKSPRAKAIFEKHGFSVK